MNGLWLVLAGRPAKVDGAVESFSTNKGCASRRRMLMFILVTNCEVDGSSTNELGHRPIEESIRCR